MSATTISTIKLENALLKYDFNNIDCDNFIENVLIVLNKYVPLKKDRICKRKSCQFYVNR